MSSFSEVYLENLSSVFDPIWTESFHLWYGNLSYSPQKTVKVVVTECKQEQATFIQRKTNMPMATAAWFQYSLHCRGQVFSSHKGPRTLESKKEWLFELPASPLASFPPSVSSASLLPLRAFPFQPVIQWSAQERIFPFWLLYKQYFSAYYSWAMGDIRV